MTPLSLLLELHRRNPVLSATGWLHVALLGLALALAPFDERLVTGSNPWVKPVKFCLSVIAYGWTLGWLLTYLPAADAAKVRWLSIGVAVTMAAEIGIIFVQAARGTTSHYNLSSPVNSLLFGIMGVMIMANLALNVWALTLVWRSPLAAAPALAWGIRLGLLLFIAGTLEGGLMIRQAAHTVGAPDGGPGLPGIGWSTRAGDLRAAHFLGMHALQALPLLGWVLARSAVANPVLLTVVGALGWLLLSALLLTRALAGRPVFLS